METLTIFYGKEKLAKLRGKHQVNLGSFAFNYPGWHTYKANCRVTKNAVISLTKKGIIEHDETLNQFRWIG
jgi:hypothetical protein